jgi:hypothetical protein
VSPIPQSTGCAVVCRPRHRASWQAIRGAGRECRVHEALECGRGGS